MKYSTMKQVILIFRKFKHINQKFKRMFYFFYHIALKAKWSLIKTWTRIVFWKSGYSAYSNNKKYKGYVLHFWLLVSSKTFQTRLQYVVLSFDELFNLMLSSLLIFSLIFMVFNTFFNFSSLNILKLWYYKIRDILCICSNLLEYIKLHVRYYTIKWRSPAITIWKRSCLGQ